MWRTTPELPELPEPCRGAGEGLRSDQHLHCGHGAHGHRVAAVAAEDGGREVLALPDLFVPPGVAEMSFHYFATDDLCHQRRRRHILISVLTEIQSMK